MTELKVERCHREDFSAMTKMWETWAEAIAQKNHQFLVKKGAGWDFQEHLSETFLDSKNAIFVARIDGKIAGFCTGHVDPSSPLMFYQNVGRVEYLCTSGENQEVNQGLIDALAAWFKSKGVEVMELPIFDPSAETLKSWNSMGFKFLRAVCQKPLS